MKPKTSVLLLLLVILIGLSQIPRVALGSPEIKIIHIDKDAWIWDGSPNMNYGSDGELPVGKSAGNKYHTLIYFDLSDIPPGSTIHNARLILTFRRYGVGFSNTFIRAHKVLAFWSEDVVTWNKRSQLIIFPFTAFNWANPGGDYDPSVIDTLTFSTADPTPPVPFDDIKYFMELKSFVQGVVDKLYPNYGVLLEADASPIWCSFYSSDEADATKRPYVRIEYTPAEIELTPSPSDQTVVQGGTATYQIVVGGTYKGNADVITDWVAPAPSGVTVIADPQNGVVPFVLTVNIETTSSTAPGDYTLRVELQGTEGSPAPKDAVLLDLHVEPAVSPDFSLLATPGTATANQGGTAQYTIEVSPIAGFSDPVTLSVSGLPSGATYSFNINNQVPPFTSTLTISIPETIPTGSYSLTVTGTGGTKSHDHPLTLEVVEGTGFTVQVTPSSQSVTQGGAAEYTVHVTGTGGFSDPVTLAILGLPPGSSVSATANSIPPDFDSVLTIQTSSDTPTGTYTLYILGTGGGLSIQSNPFTLTVNPGAGPSPTPSPTTSPTPTPSPTGFDFEMRVIPESLTIPVSGSGSVVVQLTLTSGETGVPVTLSATGLPTDATYGFRPDTVTPSDTSTLYITAGTTPGTFTVLIRARGGGLEKTATLTLVIEAQKKCVIATATYGSELSSEVQLLRGFRDNFVMKTFAGKQFIRAFNAFYYSWSTPVAGLIASHDNLRSIFKLILYPLIGTLRIVSQVSLEIMPSHPEVAVTIAGVVSSLMLGLIYFTPVLLFTVVLLKRRGYLLSSVSALKWMTAAFLTSLFTLTIGEVLLWPTLVLVGSSALVLSSLPLLALPLSIGIGKRLS